MKKSTLILLAFVLAVPSVFAADKFLDKIIRIEVGSENMNDRDLRARVRLLEQAVQQLQQPMRWSNVRRRLEVA